MTNKIHYVFLLLILSSCYFNNFAQSRASGLQCDDVPVLIPHYSPMYYSKKHPSAQFQWHKIEKEDGNNYLYEFQADTNPTFSSLVNVAGKLESTYNITTIPKINPDINHVVRIYWRVRVDTVNGIDTITPWSETSSFVLMNSKLPVFIPHENPTYTQTPTLKWRPPRDNSLRCTLKVNSDSLDLYEDTDHLYSISLNPKDTSYTFVDDTLDTGTIYWKLEYDGLISSPIQSLTIVPEEKPIPVPFDVTNSKRLEFNWKKTSDMTSYTFEIDVDINFLSPIISIPVSSTAFVPSNDIYQDISGINTKYYWRVRSNETLVWSKVNEFIIDTVPLLYRFNGEIYNNPLPTFKWDEIKSANEYSYRIQIADNHCFKPTYIEKDLEDKTEFTPSIKLQKKKIYFWRVGYSPQNKDDYMYPVEYDSISIDSININFLISATQQLSERKTASFIFFSSRKLISFSIDDPTDRILGLYVYNLKGRNIRRIILSDIHRNNIEWDYSFGNGKLVTSGMYLIKIISERQVFYKKILYYN